MVKILKVAFFTLFVFFSASCKPHVTSNSLACSRDSDCVVIGRGGCCGADLAVHKDFAEKLRLPSDEKCHTMRVQCSATEARCIEKKCAMKAQVKKSHTK